METNLKRTPKKIDNNTLHMIREDGVIHEYKFDFLLKQKAQIRLQRDREEADVDELLAACVEVDIKLPIEEEIIVSLPEVVEPVVEVKEEVIIVKLPWWKRFFNWIISLFV